MFLNFLDNISGKSNAHDYERIQRKTALLSKHSTKPKKINDQRRMRQRLARTCADDEEDVLVFGKYRLICLK